MEAKPTYPKTSDTPNTLERAGPNQADAVNNVIPETMRSIFIF